MSNLNPHHERIEADLRCLGAVLEKIRLARTQAEAEVLGEIRDAYEQLNRRMDEAVGKMEALKTAGPGMSEDLARALDGLVAELRATADFVLARVSVSEAVP